VLNAILHILSVPYRLGVGVRNALYRRAILRSCGVDRPVVSVGNLSTGGTGKTPLVKWICRFYRGRGVVPVILSRGYGRGPGAKADEVLLYEQALPEVRHCESKDRVAAARSAMAAGPVDVFVLDDGFQHRRLARSLDIVVIDAMAPPWADHLLPAGRLREPISSLSRADAIVVTRVDLINPAGLAPLREKLGRVAPHAIQAECRFAPRLLRRIPDGREESLDRLGAARVGAFCGIGSPRNFFETLRRAGIEPDVERTFSDHHWYEEEELSALADSGVELLLTTQKDAVRIGDRWQFSVPLYAVVAELQFLSGRDALERRLVGVVQSRAAGPGSG
jgi:tetraacyldisaccharide 4'-kinase